ncbi:MAG TPA: UbiD family decarboxylase, partial [Terriglobia bacterium]|nr:UbiD family decarboxylase [Terriglobia bacterium]
MAHENLREFLRALEQAGELKRIAVETDPVLEITEITDRVSKRGGPALLFEKVKGSRMPLLINAFGSPRRMAMALGVGSVEEVAARLRNLLH